MARLLVALTVVLVLGACDDDRAASDAGAGDASAAADAGAGRDAGTDDAGPRLDAGGEPDAGSDDAGVGLDAGGEPDAGSDDAGSDPDAGADDAGADAGAGFGVPCDRIVPDDDATVAAAVAAAPSPGTVCLRPGTHVGSFAMRPHVDVVGAGPSSVIEGDVSARDLDDADLTPTVLRDLTVRFGGLAALHTCPAGDPGCAGRRMNVVDGWSLHVLRVRFEPSALGGTTYCGHLAFAFAGARLRVESSVCQGERGIRVLGNVIAGTVATYDLVVERNRFEPTPGRSYIYNPLEILLSGPGSLCGDETAPVGTRVNARVRNNELFSTRYEGIYLIQCLDLAASDAVASRYEIVHNTFVVEPGRTGDQAHAIWNNSVGAWDPTLVVANNLYWGIDTAPVRGRAPGVASGNLEPASSPFVDVGAGDLRLVPGAPAIDAADPTYPVDDDIEGVARPVDGDGVGGAERDVGAREHVPPIE